MPYIFRNVNIKTLITLLKDDESAQSIFSLIFEKTCRDLNEINTSVLDELIVLLMQFGRNDESQQKILLQIGVLIVGDLSKDKKNRCQQDRFRDILFDIIKNVSKENHNVDWLIAITLPAFINIVRAHVEANKNMNTAEASSSCDEISKLMKLYLNNTVIARGDILISYQFLFCRLILTRLQSHSI